MLTALVARIGPYLWQHVPGVRFCHERLIAHRASIVLGKAMLEPAHRREPHPAWKVHLPERDETAFNNFHSANLGTGALENKNSKKNKQTNKTSKPKGLFVSLVTGNIFFFTSTKKKSPVLFLSRFYLFH